MKVSNHTNTGTMLAIVLVMVVLMPFQTMAFAQQKPIPDDLLALDHQRCMNGCVPGYGEQTCKPLCDCTIGEFKKQLTFEAYLDMSVQLTRNIVSAEMQEFLNKVANFCTGELDRNGIVIGEGVKPAPAEQNKKPGTRN